MVPILEYELNLKDDQVILHPYFPITWNFYRHIDVSFLATGPTSFDDLLKLSETVVEASQTGALSESLGIELDVITLTEPEPEPVDPTGGVRATNESGLWKVTNTLKFRITHEENCVFQYI